MLLSECEKIAKICDVVGFVKEEVLHISGAFHHVFLKIRKNCNLKSCENFEEGEVKKRKKKKKRNLIRHKKQRVVQVNPRGFTLW